LLFHGQCDGVGFLLQSTVCLGPHEPGADHREGRTERHEDQERRAGDGE
jgi:hypothetical protein